MCGSNFSGRLLGTVIVLLIACKTYGTDTTEHRSKRLVFTAGGGISRFLGAPGVPAHLATSIDPWGSAFTGRLMWHPEHLIRVGVESGIVHLYDYSIEGNGLNGSTTLSAIPLLLQWSMRIGPRFQVFAGWGTYRLNTRLDLLGRTRTSSFSQGYSAAISYSIPIADRFDAALEAKWMNAFVTRHHVLAVQCRIDWKFLEW